MSFAYGSTSVPEWFRVTVEQRHSSENAGNGRRGEKPRSKRTLGAQGARKLEDHGATQLAMVLRRRAVAESVRQLCGRRMDSPGGQRNVKTAHCRQAFTNALLSPSEVH